MEKSVDISKSAEIGNSDSILYKPIFKGSIMW